MIEAYQQAHNVSLIIQPGDSFFPIVGAIDSAAKSIKMTIFRMNDPIVKDALRNAVARSVQVQILVAIDSKGWIKRNKKLTEELAKLGVEVKAQRADKDQIKRYHYKFMLVDKSQAMILTFNPTQKNMHYTRDFGVIIRDEEITEELRRLFDADWNKEKFKPAASPLVISPYNSRERLIKLLKSATHTIRILDAKMDDTEALGVLAKQAAAGIDIKIISGKTDLTNLLPHLEVRKLARYTLHAKCIVVDGKRFFLGSQNLRAVSLDQRRELGIIIEDDAIAGRIERVFNEDWANATEKINNKR